MSQTERDDLLIEIGSEELPPKALLTLATAFERLINDALSQAGLGGSDSQRYATPRRLAVKVDNVPLRQPEQRQQRRGPAVKSAFSADGRPSKAALGFAQSCGVDVEQLERLSTDKGEWLVYSQNRPGAETAQLLPDIVASALAGLPIPKRMRWGRLDVEYSRPVRWIVLLHGETPIVTPLLGVDSGQDSFGHRFHHPQPVPIRHPREYPETLRKASVIVDFTERKQSIEQQVRDITVDLDNGEPLIEAALLDEVNALVEWPVALLGRFEPRFLEVPPEALISTMQDHQKYFPIQDTDGKLLPYFITVANLDSNDPDQIRHGNERVIRSRFSDAEFFWRQDLKTSLDSLRPALEKVIFQQRLGSQQQKSARVKRLASAIAALLDTDAANVERAAELAKCDLLTDMVQEFPELQGIMGRYYARHDGEPDEVAQALAEQYQPRFAGDALPETTAGRLLALCERLDTLVGIFAAGQIPSGNRDPFALRRAALGALRLLIELRWDLDLYRLLELAAAGYPDELNAPAAVSPVFDFMMERLRGYYTDRQQALDAFEAVSAQRPTRPYDFHRRLLAVNEFRRRDEAASLAAANKRIGNLLKKTETGDDPRILDSLLVEDAEIALARHLEQLEQTATPLFEEGRYSAALAELATLKTPVDRFFDDVMVMTDDEALKNNRLALLARLQRLFLRTADLSRLQH